MLNQAAIVTLREIVSGRASDYLIIYSSVHTARSERFRLREIGNSAKTGIHDFSVELSKGAACWTCWTCWTWLSIVFQRHASLLSTVHVLITSLV